MKTLNTCPLCSSEKIQQHFDVHDDFLTKEKFSIYICKNCGFRFTNPRPESENLASYYCSDEYIAHSNTRRGLVASIYQVVRNFTIRRKVQYLAIRREHGCILDIGCATGEFLHAFTKRGWHATGVEPDESAAAFARAQYGLDVFPEEQIEKFPENSFDIVSMWHVLEHVENFHQRINEIKRILKPGGILVIAVPNSNSNDAIDYGSFWAGWDVPRHLSHFSQSNIKMLCSEKSGLKYVNTVPMLFDSFYVSILSEKYKGTRFGFFHGLISGLRSNVSASKTGEYSSLTYIFQKKV